MSLSASNDFAPASHRIAGTNHRLSYQGEFWAQAFLNPDAESVTIGCTSPPDQMTFPILVKVELELDRPLACTIRVSAVKAWPTSSHRVLERLARGAEQLLALLDAAGQPWGELEIGDAVHLFDPAGRERARVLRAYDKNGSRLALRCWDESGHEIAGEEFLSA